MRTRNITIRHWGIRFFFLFEGKDKDRIDRALLWAGAPNSIFDKVSALIEEDAPNVGFAYSNLDRRRTVVGVGYAETGPEFLDTIVHEIFHIAQNIASADGLDLAGEEVAYLAGDISRTVSDIVCEVSCPHCHKKGPS